MGLEEGQTGRAGDGASETERGREGEREGHFQAILVLFLSISHSLHHSLFFQSLRLYLPGDEPASRQKPAAGCTIRYFCLK